MSDSIVDLIMFGKKAENEGKMNDCKFYKWMTEWFCMHIHM